jgi:hypothetical protein
MNLSIFLSLPRDYPGIVNVDIQWDDDQEDDNISEIICQWNCLESFTWHGAQKLSHRALIHLSNLPNLQTMDIDVPDLGGGWQSYLVPSQQPGFRALERAVLIGNFSSCASLMDIAVSHCLIHSLVVKINGDLAAASMARFFQTLNNRCSHMALRELEVNSRYAPLTDQRVVDESMFRPLLAFTNLVKVNIWVPFIYRLGNGIMRDIAGSWTKLEVLMISQDAGWGGGSRLTLAGLIPLLSLPNLTVLNIVVDASSVDYTLDMRTTGVSNTRIFSLRLGDSVIQSAHSVAAFLSDVLPNVRVISSWGEVAARRASVSLEDARKYQSRWQKVAALVETMAKVREQERRSMMEHINTGASTYQSLLASH